jgi:hypothetical protein
MRRRVKYGSSNGLSSVANRFEIRFILTSFSHAFGTHLPGAMGNTLVDRIASLFGAASFRLKTRWAASHCQTVSPMKEHEQPMIPELWIIREIVRRYMPEGHTLKSVDLSIGSLEEGQEPRFLVLIELKQDAHAPEPFGWADKMAKMIRQHWPNDDFYVKVKIILAPDDARTGMRP